MQEARDIETVSPHTNVFLSNQTISTLMGSIHISDEGRNIKVKNNSA